jgi:hypothetical protein
VLTEFVGVSATHGPLAGRPGADIPEVQLRVAVRGQDRSAIERFTKEIAPLILTGPPEVEEIVAYWPALIPKEEIMPVVEVLET